jgi:hypothetical protein
MFIFSTGYLHTDNGILGQNFLPNITNGSDGNIHGSESGHPIKNSPNLNIQLQRPVKNVTENITIKYVDENETNIMVINT